MPAPPERITGRIAGVTGRGYPGRAGPVLRCHPAMNDLLRILHILFAAAWLGGGLLTGFAAPRMARNGASASLGWARVSAEAGRKYFNPAGILTVLTGIALVMVGDLYQWSDTFVSIGLGAAIATALVGAFAHRPGSTRIIAALESGDYETAATEGKKAAIWGAVTSALLIVVVVVMVLKTGSG